jgi:hypothetical protein
MYHEWRVKKYKILVEEAHEKRPLVGSRHRCKYNIKINPVEICRKVVI